MATSTRLAATRSSMLIRGLSTATSSWNVARRRSGSTASADITTRGDAPSGSAVRDSTGATLLSTVHVGQREESRARVVPDVRIVGAVGVGGPHPGAGGPESRAQPACEHGTGGPQRPWTSEGTSHPVGREPDHGGVATIRV